MLTVRAKHHTVLPGFRVTLGFTLLYLSVIVLIPLAGLPHAPTRRRRLIVLPRRLVPELPTIVRRPYLGHAGSIVVVQRRARVAVVAVLVLLPLLLQ